MATKPKPSKSAPVFAIVVERTVRLQHVLMVPASDVDAALEQAEAVANEMDDTAFDWREDAVDAWSAFGRRYSEPGEL
jgi:predicted NodU family carbamoyl transferase